MKTAPQVEICRWKYDAPFAYSMTYDEGTVDAIANSLPVHEKFGFPGHVDVVAGQLGQQRKCWLSSLNDQVHMSADELKYLINKGWGVGNHSWSHYVHPCQPGLDLYREVVWSKYQLEDMIEHPVRIFTIPNDTHNYEPVIDLVKQHYLACANVDGGPNRECFDFYKIGNFMVAVGEIYPRPGWPEEMKTDNLDIDFIKDAWIYETTHLVKWNVAQNNKCITPEALTQRFEKLLDISSGKLWAAKPDDVIDYELLKRNLRIVNIRSENNSSLVFDVDGEWPVGVINAYVTLRITGGGFDGPPTIDQTFGLVPGGYSALNLVERIVQDGNGWLITMQLAPHRTVRLKNGEASIDKHVSEI